ncbi:MAG: adenylate/guanylate cyclase domain-containing protein, partial [Planctomycetota bacterium]|nr:adenylate/guanylate cyclase domain-containing protein [Planctomycetota bacterium]
MLELLVTGKDTTQCFSTPLVESKTLRLGRSSQCEISVHWDREISRIHAEVTLSHGYVLIRKLDAARNLLVYRDKESASVNLQINEEFLIGQTTFRVTSTGDETTNIVKDSAVNEYTFAPGELRKVPFVQTQGRSLELLATIPQIMRESQDDPAFAGAMVKLLLEAIPRCHAAAVVVFDHIREREDLDKIPKPSLVRWNSRDDGAGHFRPSHRLMAKAISTQQSVLHIWDSPGEEAVFTNLGNLDWAFCIPLQDESSRGWCLYLSGAFDSLLTSVMKNALQEPMRFTELMAQFISATRSVRLLQKTQTRMASFFPPAVVKTITNENADAMLQPRTSKITVLFCDLRGFSKKTEQADGDLPALLIRISAALSAMVRSIMEHGGVIADFQGDAVLSFWGWPQAPAAGPLLACRAAMDMRKQFADGAADQSHPLYGLSIGIGIGHGIGIAGQIGPPEQSKVGVFGAVVNQASRLQGMTKQFRTQILIDDKTATVIRERG